MNGERRFCLPRRRDPAIHQSTARICSRLREKLQVAMQPVPVAAPKTLPPEFIRHLRAGQPDGEAQVNAQVIDVIEAEAPEVFVTVTKMSSVES